MPRASGGSRCGPPQCRRRIAEALALLPAEERDILFHAYCLRWTVERIACHFDVSPDIIRLRLHEALQRLRRYR